MSKSSREREWRLGWRVSSRMPVISRRPSGTCSISSAPKFNEEGPPAHPWHHDGAGGIRRPGADRVHHAGGRAVRLSPDVVDRPRRHSDHRVHGDVRPRRGRGARTCLRDRPETARQAAGGAHPRRVQSGEFADVRRRVGSDRDRHSPRHRTQRTFRTGRGIILGSLLTCALLILGAIVFLPRAIFPDLLSTTALPAALPFALTALRLALLGILACVARAAVETALSGGYNICQFYGLKWDKN